MKERKLSMKIRIARLEDAAGIAKVHVDSWRTTYQGIVPKDYLDSLSYEQRTDLWQRNLSHEAHFGVVALNRQGDIIGFADARRKDEDLIQQSIHLTSIYLLAAYQGRGIGKKLLKEMFEYFKQLQVQKVFVEALEENSTCSFYEYYGAELIETIQIEIAGKKLNERIYMWSCMNNVIKDLSE